jgi:hypothetical protein
LEEFKLRKREDFVSSDFNRSCVEESIWSSAVLIIERKRRLNGTYIEFLVMVVAKLCRR